MRLEEVWCHAWIVPSGLVGISKQDLSAFTVFVSVIKTFGVVCRRASLGDWRAGRLVMRVTNSRVALGATIV